MTFLLGSFTSSSLCLQSLVEGLLAPGSFPVIGDRARRLLLVESHTMIQAPGLVSQHQSPGLGWSGFGISQANRDSQGSHSCL